MPTGTASVGTQKKATKSPKIMTPEFRVSFPTVFTAGKVNPGDPNEKAKFRITMLFRIEATEASKAAGETVVDIEPLKAAVRTLLIAKFGADRTQWPKLKLPFRSGEEPEKKDVDGFGKGIVFVSASTDQRPGLVDAARQPIIDPNEFYGGCYARATINPFWYDRAGNKGVAFGLQNVQKIRDGQPFSGRKKPEDDFDVIATPTEGATAVAGKEEQGGSGIGV